jgi:hypothetical protein
MGYCTRFTIVAYDYQNGQKEKIATFDDSCLIDEMAGSLADDITSIVGYIPTYDSCKWYGHADDMLAVSNKHPNTLFKVHGEGEEAGDIWDKWFLNGKMQVCEAKIVIPDFDPEQLK